jgi:hypothetical protein
MTTSVFLIATVTTLGTVAAVVVRPDSPSPPASEIVFTGGCDASAGLLLDEHHLLVADDEDKKKTELRVYDLRSPGAPKTTVDLTAALAPDTEEPEVDLEGLTRFGSRFALMGSHSRRGDQAKPAPSRRRILAFAVSGTAPALTLGKAARYEKLVEQAQAFLTTLPESDPLKMLVLDRAVPSKKGGLSIEALSETATPGELLIGLRSPLGPGAQALLLLVTNAAAVLDSGAAAAFAPPIRLDLGKQGLRDVVRDPKSGDYVILAGNAGDGGTFALWRWAGPSSTSKPTKIRAVDTPGAGTSAEGVVLAATPNTAWILFDEGERPLPNPTADLATCKDQKRPDRSFRVRSIDLAAR